MKKQVLALAVGLALVGGGLATALAKGDALERAEAGDAAAIAEVIETVRPGSISERVEQVLTKAAEDGSSKAHYALALNYQVRPWDAALDQRVETHLRGCADAIAACKTDLGLTQARRAMDGGISEAERKAFAEEAMTALEPGIADATAEALWHVGFLLRNGLGVPVDLLRGDGYIEQAANKGSAAAAYYLSRQHSDRDRLNPAMAANGAYVSKALEYLLLAAHAGHRVAMDELAWRYAQGDGVPADTSQAEFWKAAAQSDRASNPRTLPAQVAPITPVSLGDMGDTRVGVVVPLAKGVQVAVTGAKSASTFSLLAEQPVAATCAMVPSNAAEVDSRITALENQLQASELRAQRLQQQLDDANRRLASASGQYQDAAQLNQKALAAAMEGDYETAIPMFRRAAEANHDGAVSNLGAAYLNGTGVPKDTQQALKLFERSAMMGNVIAAENAAKLYDYGMAPGGPNRARAIQWYERAAALGSAVAIDAITRLKQ